MCSRGCSGGTRCAAGGRATFCAPPQALMANARSRLLSHSPACYHVRGNDGEQDGNDHSAKRAFNVAHGLAPGFVVRWLLGRHARRAGLSPLSRSWMFFGHSSSIDVPAGNGTGSLRPLATSVSDNMSDPSPLPEATCPAVRTEGDTVHVVAMTEDRLSDRCTLRHVPQPNRTVQASGDKRLAVVAEGNGPYALARLHRRACCVPCPTATSHRRSVWSRLPDASIAFSQD